jgi:hypothetical protein
LKVAGAAVAVAAVAAHTFNTGSDGAGATNPPESFGPPPENFVLIGSAGPGVIDIENPLVSSESDKMPPSASGDNASVSPPLWQQAAAGMALLGAGVLGAASQTEKRRQPRQSWPSGVDEETVTCEEENLSWQWQQNRTFKETVNAKIRDVKSHLAIELFKLNVFEASAPEESKQFERASATELHLLEKMKRLFDLQESDIDEREGELKLVDNLCYQMKNVGFQDVAKLREIRTDLEEAKGDFSKADTRTKQNLADFAAWEQDSAASLDSQTNESPTFWSTSVEAQFVKLLSESKEPAEIFKSLNLSVEMSEIRVLGAWINAEQRTQLAWKAVQEEYGKVHYLRNIENPWQKYDEARSRWTTDLQKLAGPQSIQDVDELEREENELPHPPSDSFSAVRVSNAVSSAASVESQVQLESIRVFYAQAQEELTAFLALEPDFSSVEELDGVSLSLQTVDARKPGDATEFLYDSEESVTAAKELIKNKVLAQNPCRYAVRDDRVGEMPERFHAKYLEENVDPVTSDEITESSDYICGKTEPFLRSTLMRIVNPGTIEGSVRDPMNRARFSWEERRRILRGIPDLISPSADQDHIPEPVTNAQQSPLEKMETVEALLRSRREQAELALQIAQENQRLMSSTPLTVIPQEDRDKFDQVVNTLQQQVRGAVETHSLAQQTLQLFRGRTRTDAVRGDQPSLT